MTPSFSYLRVVDIFFAKSVFFFLRPSCVWITYRFKRWLQMTCFAAKSKYDRKLRWKPLRFKMLPKQSFIQRKAQWLLYWKPSPVNYDTKYCWDTFIRRCPVTNHFWILACYGWSIKSKSYNTWSSLDYGLFQLQGEFFFQIFCFIHTPKRALRSRTMVMSFHDTENTLSSAILL